MKQERSHGATGGALDQVIRTLSTLPGLGPRSARRVALYLLEHKLDVLKPLIAALDSAAETVTSCHSCGNLDSMNPCRICADPTRDHGVVCVVAGVADVWAIERTGSYKGVYHILGGVVSALDGVTPEQLRIPELQARLEKNNITEIILGLSATVDGQTTAHIVQDKINAHAIPVTKLAHGVPVGGELDYLDDGTIVTALRSRARA
jgi:recombination protein RecR